MTDPAVALMVFAVLVAVSLLLFWPRRGLVVKALQLLSMTERVLVEDALKHLYNCEYAGSPGSVASLAVALEMPTARVGKLVERLRASDLIRSAGKELSLTEAGRSYALRVVRTHRLWERYLADRTNFPPGEWHEEAERREHMLGPAETEELAARMGHPLYDPHGAPIPTADGQLPRSEGVALTALEPGQAGTIVNLEDEPRETYERLVAADLAPLVVVRLLESSPESIRFTADGRELRFEPAVATGITVSPLSSADAEVEPRDSLSDLEPGESATVVRISQLCQGPQRRRLLDLGLVPGTVVAAELEGALKDPVAYRIRGALVALRKEQADLIYVRRKEVAARG